MRTPVPSTPGFVDGGGWGSMWGPMFRRAAGTAASAAVCWLAIRCVIDFR